MAEAHDDAERLHDDALGPALEPQGVRERLGADVAVSVTGPVLPLVLVRVTASPPMASSTAAAAAPNRIGGRLYQGSGPGSGS